MKQHVLIVDDDEMIQAMVSFLVKEEFSVRTTQVETGLDMHTVLKSDRVDLVILDLGLPDEDGLALARQIRARDDVPIIVLTGDQSHERLISALEIGVNDFITKPFDPYELRLRVKNLLRYNHPRRRTSANAEDEQRIQIGDMRLDLNRRSLDRPDGTIVPLTISEFNILSALALKPGKALSRGDLLDVIAQGGDGPSPRAIDVYIRQIRQKIEPNAHSPQFIQAVRGYGYIFVGQTRPKP
ncbi:response regulator transcription factor [Magnetovibrio sp.]|uniref:response regulator transcription factor n=1 Tax=Magnetovibrio sp. TaxID=2024836 RepID=UPI002F93C480